MALTVPDLVSTPELGLRLLTSGSVSERAVTWVHVSELDDPTPFLTGGELLLTTGLMIGSALDVEQYVRRLADATVVALGFGTGLSHAEVPRELLAAADRYSLPLLEVPRETPFIAISRAVSAAVAADEYASVARTFTAQQALTKAALAAGGPERLVRLLAQQLLGWVLLLDPYGAPIAAHPESARAKVDGLTDEIAVLAAHRGTVSSAFPLGPDTVSLQSIGAGSSGRAFLAVGRAAQLTATDRHLVNAAVMLLTIRLDQTSTKDAGLALLRTALLRLTLSGQVEVARPVANHLRTMLPVEPLTVLVATGNVTAVLAQLGDPSVPGAHPLLMGELDDALVAVVGGGAAEATDTANQILLADQDLPGGAAIGISGPTGYSDIAAAYRHARQAADFGRHHGHPITEFREIAMPGIAGLVAPDQARAFAESLLGPLIEHDNAGRGDLVNSLRVWLTHHGQWDPSATMLGVHRHTLRHRMRLVEELLDRSLDSPGTRGELWLALSVWDPGEDPTTSVPGN